MPPSPMTTQGTLRFLRTVHGALIASILGYCLVLWEIPTPTPQPPDPLMTITLGAVSAAMLITGLIVRSRMIGRAHETLRSKPDDAESLKRWRVGAILSACLAEAVMLYGLVIYLIGRPVQQAVPFFVAGTLAMLLWWPKQP